MYKEMQVKNLSNENSLVAVSGFIVSKDESSFVLDDKTSQIVILSKDEINIGDYVRVFGNLIFNGNEKILQAGIIQNLNEINKELHQKLLKQI
ncbi:hypothetical protein J4427_03635 [Candidatus Woesearchaeota archaeon]|nr:hypothetical protein [Candidatus Woesearchaeota archaeon]